MKKNEICHEICSNMDKFREQLSNKVSQGQINMISHMESKNNTNESVCQIEMDSQIHTLFRKLKVIQFSSVTQLCPTLRPHELQHTRPPCPSPTLGVYPNSCPLSWDAIQPSHPLSSSSPSALNLYQHQSLFQWVNSSNEVQKYWSFNFSISPSKEHPGLISFRMDWLDLLAVQGTLKSLLQYHSSKPSILQHSSFLHSPTLTSIHDHWKNHSFD